VSKLARVDTNGVSAAFATVPAAVFVVDDDVAAIAVVVFVDTSITEPRITKDTNNDANLMFQRISEGYLFKEI
jgi:hypothetical protein